MNSRKEEKYNEFYNLLTIFMQGYSGLSSECDEKSRPNPLDENLVCFAN